MAICRRNNVDTRVLSQGGLREGEGVVGEGRGKTKDVVEKKKEGREQLKDVC